MASGMGGLPGDTRFLHIGPHKTGTTAVQGALHLARERLAEHGLAYIGKGRQPAGAAQQASGRPPMFGSVHQHDDLWQRLLDEVEARGDLRPVLSSEFFCEADDDSARRIVDDLGGSRVHVVVTLRPLTKILSAQWQQFVQAGLVRSYEEWLKHIFDGSSAEQFIPTFWRRHDHGSLIRRWSEIVGRENLTVIAVDDSDPGMLLRSFEEILDLPGEFLAPDETQANRSLSYGEAEIFRRFNRVFRDSELDEKLYGDYIRRGLVPHLKLNHRPPRDDAVILTPAWAMERAAEVGREAAATVAELGLRSIGDPALLGDIPKSRVGTPSQGEAVPVDAAAHALLGAVIAAGEREAGSRDKAAEKAEKAAKAAARDAAAAAREKAAAAAEKARRRDPDRLPNVPARRLARELVNRALRRIRRAFGRLSPPVHNPGTAQS